MEPIPFGKCSSRNTVPISGQVRKPARRMPRMNAQTALSRWVTLATFAALAGVLFVMAFAPQPSLYAG
jgi:hypothetical protein